jgi:hypothetical protein
MPVDIVDPVAFNVERGNQGHGGRGWWKRLEAGSGDPDGHPEARCSLQLTPASRATRWSTRLGVLLGILGPRAWPVGVETTFSNPLNNVQQHVEQCTPLCRGRCGVQRSRPRRKDVAGVRGCGVSLWAYIRSASDFRMLASPGELPSIRRNKVEHLWGGGRQAPSYGFCAY